VRELPQGWAWATLGELSTSVSNGIFVSRPGVEPDGVPILRINAVRKLKLHLDDLRYSRLSHQELRDRDALLTEGNLLFTRYSGSREYVGVCAAVPMLIDYLTYPDKLIRARLASAIDASYVAYAFASPVVRDQVDAILRTTAGQVGVASRDLQRVRIPVPPLSEQQRVVRAVDEYVSRLGVADCLLSSVGQRLANLDSSVLAEAHQKALDSGAELRTIGSLAETSLGKMLDADKSSGVPTLYLANANVRWGHFDIDDLRSVALEPWEVEKFRVSRGDVMVCEGGEPGRCTVWQSGRTDVTFQKALHRVRVSESLLPEWFAVMLCEAVVSGRVDRFLTGTTIKHLPQQQLRQIELPVPSIDAQAAIFRSVDEVSQAAVRTRTAVDGGSTRSAKLSKDLLVAAFRGELVDHDPSDEPADVLLARIRAEREAAAPKKSKPRTRKATAQ